jgi:hypothetical protein
VRAHALQRLPLNGDKSEPGFSFHVYLRRTANQILSFIIGPNTVQPFEMVRDLVVRLEADMILAKVVNTRSPLSVSPASDSTSR